MSASFSPAVVLYERPHPARPGSEVGIDREHAARLALDFTAHGFAELLAFTLARGIAIERIAMTEGRH